MREIKFRGLIRYQSGKGLVEKWVYYGVSSKPQILGGEWLFEDLQYTGLHDKNGVEIYDDDVVALMRCPDKHFGCVCEKTPDKESARVFKFIDGSFTADIETELKFYTVIGNTHDKDLKTPPTK